MPLLYLNPFSGIAGDMLVGALLDLGADQPDFWRQLHSLPLPAHEWSVRHERVNRHGIAATHFVVDFKEHAPPPHAFVFTKAHTHSHHHRHLPEILDILAASAIDAPARLIAERTFRALAEAEGAVHGIAPEEVHFHEVGAVDAIADITGAAIAATLLGIDRVICAPVHVGSGTVHCAHGDMPVPVPAVAKLLAEAPTVIGSAKGELTTPTGAALLRGLQASFGGQPAGRILASGYGAGTRDFPGRANVLQAVLLQEEPVADDDTASRIVVLACNLDDMTGEQLGWLLPRLMQAGALDVAAIPCTMKKNRPGIQLEVMANPADRERLTTMLLRETSTFGVRWYAASRSVLRRKSVEVETTYGTAMVKLGYLGDEVEPLRISPEYESCRRLAEQHQLPMDRIYLAVRHAAESKLRN